MKNSTHTAVLLISIHGVELQWCYWRKWIGWLKMRSMHWDVQWRSIVRRVVSFCAVIRLHASFPQYVVDVLLSGLQHQHMTRCSYCDLSWIVLTIFRHCLKTFSFHFSYSLL